MKSAAVAGQPSRPARSPSPDLPGVAATAPVPPTCRQAVLPAMALAALGTTLHVSGIDLWIADQLFDAGAGVFPHRSGRLLELIGHDLARTVVVCVWFVMLAAAVLAPRLEPIEQHRRLLVAIVVAMAAGPLVVVVLKDVTAFPCPWDLVRYGGPAPQPTHWFVAPRSAGRCFPSGHSAAGFCLFGFYFAAAAIGPRRQANAVLVAVALVGLAFSLVRIVQGAHFASHALWAAAICWAVAASVFGWLLPTPGPVHDRPTVE